MRKVLALMVALVLLSLAVLQNPGKETDLVVKVIDGDTVILASGERVRLIGINAPERGEPCYEEAKRALENLVLFKNVTLERDAENRDRYGRLLRYIFVNGTFVNSKMLEDGFAVLYYVQPNAKYLRELGLAEKTGRERGGCVWRYSNTTAAER